MQQHTTHADAGERPISRVIRSKGAAQATYDRLSRWYDLVEGPFERKSVEAGLRQLAVQNGETVLEIGFGTGRAIVALAQTVGHSGHVVGIDLAPGMVERAQARVRMAGLTERVELLQGDATHLPFPDEHFDAIFMSFVLELFDSPEIPVVLQECYRVLRRGGRIGVVALSKGATDTAMLRLYEWAHQRFPVLVDCRPIYARMALEAADFDVLTVSARSLWGLPVEMVVASKDRRRFTGAHDMVAV